MPFSCLPACWVCFCVFECQRKKKRSLWCLTFSLLGTGLSCSFLSVCVGFGKQMTSCFLDPLFELSLLFLYFSLSFPYFFCVFLLLDVFPELPGVCFDLPSFCLSFLPSLLSSMQRLSLWQTCAITRTLWIIARLSIKGVISPQWPTPWQEWAPPPRSRPCPVVPGPSPTSMIASSAQPVRRPSRGSR